METPWSKRVLIQFGLALWALVTFMLLVATVLLYWQVVELGARPGAASAPSGQTQATEQARNASSPAAPSASAPERRKVSVHYYDPATGEPVALPTEMEWTGSTAANLRRALEALLQPPPAGAPCHPPSIKSHHVIASTDGWLNKSR